MRHLIALMIGTTALIHGNEEAQLTIVQIGDPVLLRKTRPLTKEEIVSPEIQQLIQTMKATMLVAQGIGLAAPQIGKSIQLAVIEDMNYSHLTPEELLERGREQIPFHVIINPQLFIEEEVSMVEFFEGCLSIPELLGIVSRAKSVRVECLNEKAEPTVIYATGWYARILQHEIDHLNQTLFLHRVKLPTLMTDKNYTNFWRGKPIESVQLIYN